MLGWPLWPARWGRARLARPMSHLHLENHHHPSSLSSPYLLSGVMGVGVYGVCVCGAVLVGVGVGVC